MTVFNFPDTSGRPTDGSFTWTAPNGLLYAWDGDAWRTIGGTGGDGNASITVTDDLSTIINPEGGDLAWHTVEARLYIYYQDDDSQQWVDASPAGDAEGGGGDGASVTVSDSPPIGAGAGDLWWDSSEEGDSNGGRLYINYSDGNSLQWVQTSNVGGLGDDGDPGEDGVRYQQGTWEMTWTGNGSVISTGTPTWIRIGNQVLCWVNVVFPTTSNTDIQVLDNLPYPHGGNILSGYTSSSGNTAGFVLLQNQTDKQMLVRGGNNQNLNMTRDQTSGKSGQFCIQYETNDTTFIPSGQNATVTSDIQGTPGTGGGGGGGGDSSGSGADAWGTVAADGTLRGGFNCTTERRGPGEYTVTFVTPMPNDDYSVTLGSQSYNPSVKAGRTAQSFEVSIANSTNTPTDFRFDFAVHGSNTIAPQAGVGADAWGVYRDGTLQANFNIASVNKVLDGVYEYTFTTPMPSAEYSVVASSENRICGVVQGTQTATKFRVLTAVGTVGQDINATANLSVAVFASSTITPTYTWTRNGTTLEPANAGDDISANGNILTAVTDNLGPGSTELRPNGSIRNRHDGSIDTTYTYALYSGGNDPSDLSLLLRSNGQVEIGGSLNASRGISNPNITLNADGSAAVGPGSFGTLAPGSIASHRVYCWDPAAGSAAQVVLQPNGIIRAANTTVQPLVGSERRLKNSIQLVDRDAAWETIKNVPFYSFSYKESDGSIVYGPMVDEVPAEMQMDTERSDEEGVIRTYDNGMLQARLYTALQTALTRIETLEAKVQQLEGGTN